MTARNRYTTRGVGSMRDLTEKVKTKIPVKEGMYMTMRRVLVAIVLLLGASVATNAAAAILATGAVYGGSTQNDAVCYIYNAGTTSISFVSEKIVAQDGSNAVLSTNNCST